MAEWLQHLHLGAALEHDDKVMPGWLFWTYVGISAGLVTMAGLMSGLTLGLMSLDELDLEVLKRSGTDSEKRHAKRIVPVIANTHFLLVTLLLFNALSTEALPIFLDRLVDPVTAVVLSVTVVLVIGEILPQAVCRSFGLQVGSYSSWLVRLLMIISAPISWPIGKFIDWLLGQDHTALFRRAQLKALVGLHSTAEGLGGNLTADEISIITGALDLTSKTAWTAMTPLDKVFMLAADRVLDESTLQEILISGHSRIPLHEPGDRCKLTGLLLVKELVLVDPEQGLTAGQLVSRPLPRLPADTPMYQLLRLFEAGGSHMVALTKPPNTGAYDMLKRSSGSGPVLPLSPAGKNPSFEGPLGLARTLTPDLGLVKIKSGIIKAGDREIYVEAEQKEGGGGLGGGAGGGLVDGDGALLNSDGIGGGSGVVYSGGSGDLEFWGHGKEGDVVGIITIEDVIEELLQQEIIDETDQYVDNMQIMRVDAYALTTNLPPRLRKAYHQQFMPRVGRLVVHQHHHNHNYHHHMLPSHAAAAAAVHGSSWPKGGSSSEQQWMHMPQAVQALYEGRVVVSNPATPLGGSPPGGHYHHYPPAAAAAAMSPEERSETSLSRFSSSSSSMGHSRSFFAGMPPDHQGQQQQPQQGNNAHHGYDQAVVRRESSDGSGYVTYNIYSLTKRRSAESGQTPGQTSGQTSPEGSTHGGRHVPHHLEGSTHRQPHMAVQFQAVREGLMEGFSPSAATSALAAAAAAGTARREGVGSGSTSGRAAAAAAAGGGEAGGLEDMRQPLLSHEDSDDERELE